MDSIGNRGSDVSIVGCRRIALALGMLWLLLAGCSEHVTSQKFETLIRVNKRSISVGEFNNRYDTASAEFPTQFQADPAVEKELKLRLLHQLTEELILFERAAEMGLSVGAEELQAAIGSIKADYPEGEFEKVLLEQVISYDVWKEQMRRRLLKEKVVREDLEASIELTPQEMAALYESLYPTGGTGQEGQLNQTDMDAKVVKLLRRKKAQETYRSWFESLQDRYEIEINAAAWEKIINS